MKISDRFKDYLKIRKEKLKKKRPLDSKENLLLVLLFCFASLVWIAYFLGPKGQDRGSLEVAFIDVGQGDSIFIQTPSKRNILIDGGPLQNNHVLRFLKKKNVDILNSVVLTHPDLDHLGGLLNVLREIKVEQVIDPGVTHSLPEYQIFLELIKEMGIAYKIPELGQILKWDPELVVQVLGPLKNYKGTESDTNNNSLVIRLFHGLVSFLFTGDIEAVAEYDLSEYGRGLVSTILKSPHHGSSNSSTARFLDLVKPEVVVISCGRNNEFGYPHEEVLKRYEQRKIKVLRTDWQGTIIIESDGSRYRIRNE